MYNLDFDENPSRAMSFVFKSKIVILYLTGSKRVNSRRASTPYAGFLAGVQSLTGPAVRWYMHGALLDFIPDERSMSH